MKKLYLLDTNAVSEIMKPAPGKAFVDKLSANEERCVISSPTWNELMFGLNLLPPGKKKSFLSAFLFDEVQRKFEIIPYNDHAALIHADLRMRLKEAGTPIEYEDTEIASVAIANQLILVTNNARHFEAISRVDSVFRYESW
ncbi:MAG: PIN domain-containing protein [Treponema sp.]|nr:PIN domain-containing protein [Candidatus Treponema caballi]